MEMSEMTRQNGGKTKNEQGINGSAGYSGEGEGDQQGYAV